MASENSSWYLFVVAVLVAGGTSLPFGYNMGMLSQQYNMLQEFFKDTFKKRDLATDEGTVSMWCFLTILALVFGGCLGSIISGTLMPRRKTVTTLLLPSLLSLMVGLFLTWNSTAVWSYEQLILGRFLMGVHCGVGNTIGPMFLSDIAPTTLRGFMSSFHQLFITIGYLMSNVLSNPVLQGTSWNTVTSGQIPFAMVLFVCVPFLECSPRFYFMVRNDEERAKRAIKRYRGAVTDELVEEELAALRQEKEREDQRPANQRQPEQNDQPTENNMLLTQCRNIFDTRTYIHTVCMLMLIQQLSGINVILLYPGTLLALEGYTINPVIAISIINVLFTGISMWRVDHVKRRDLLFYPLMIMAGMLGLGIFCSFLIKLPNDPLNLIFGHPSFVSTFVYERTSDILFVGVAIYVVCYALGPGPIPWLMASELLSHQKRPTAMAVATMFNWIFTLLVVSSLKGLHTLFGLETVLFIVSLALVGSAAFVFHKLPDTMGRTQAEISAAEPFNVNARVDGNGDHAHNE